MVYVIIINQAADSVGWRSTKSRCNINVRGIFSISLPCMLCIVDVARSCSVERASTFVLPVDLSQEFLEKDLFLQPQPHLHPGNGMGSFGGDRKVRIANQIRRVTRTHSTEMKPTQILQAT